MQKDPGRRAAVGGAALAGLTGVTGLTAMSTGSAATASRSGGGASAGRAMDPAEHAAWELTRALIRDDGTLTDEQYDQARTALGERTLFELSTLVGCYATLALQLRLFAVPAPEPTPTPTE